MSGSPLTVPPPQDDDHEDVAWALRAASAQWRRAAHQDAVHWIERAAETAQEIGAAARAFELKLLAQQLSGGTPQVAVAPPPPVAAIAPPPPSMRTSAPSVDVEEVEVDFDLEMDDDEVELLDDEDDIEFVEEDQPTAAPVAVSPVPPPRTPPPMSARAVAPAPAPLPPLPAAPPAAPLPPPITSGPPPAPSRAAEAPESPRRNTTTSPKLDMMPPSMRPVPSGLDLDDEAIEPPPADDDVEFGELEFEDEADTRRVSVTPLPPAPDLGHVEMDHPQDFEVERETAAEYAQTGIEAPPLHDDDDIEKELGVDLSLRVVSEAAAVAPASPLAPSPFDDEPQAPSPWEEFDPEAEEADFGGPPLSDVPPPSPSSMPPGAISEHSPVPGRASVHPAKLEGASGRTASAVREPYGLAPSAQLPPTSEISSPGPIIEPPSRPSHAPPPSDMQEPEQRPSNFPVEAGDGTAVEIPPASAAPNLEEFDEMFAALSQPPAAPSTPPVAADGPLADAPIPTEFVAAPPQAEVQAESAGSVIDGVDLLEVEGFQDLPEEAAAAMAASAELRSLQPREEVSGFGVALVTHGMVMLMPTVADAPCHMARKGEVLFTQGTLSESAQVRVVGMDGGSRVAVFSQSALDEATSSCPWVADDLAQLADKYLAFAGGVLGPLGDLDDMFRFMVLEKCTVKSKPEGALIAEAKKPMDGMYILGGGVLELLAEDGSVVEELGMGDFVFPETVLSAGSARGTVRVGKGGALVLYADRMGAHELLATCPPFIELLAG